MNNEQFEYQMRMIEHAYNPTVVTALRARDTAQREVLARVEAERDALRDNLALARSERDRVIALLKKRDTAQAQLAEAVGLLREVELWSDGTKSWLDKLASFLDRHAQAEQQEAQGAQAVDERAAFESSLHPSLSRETFVDEEGDTVYRYTWVQGAWIGWQARAALATQPAVRGAEHE